MAKRPHTSLQCSPDGPWVTLRDGDDALTFNVQEIVRETMPAQPDRQRRIMARWLKARDAEGEVAKIAAPDVPVGTRLGPRMPDAPRMRTDRLPWVERGS